MRKLQLICVLFVLHRISADTMPVPHRILIPRIPIRILPPLQTRVPIHIVPKRSTRIIPTAQPIVDDNTGNFTQPGELAKQCLTAEGSMYEKCQNDGVQDYKAYQSDNDTVSVWEQCCIVYKEIACYQRNAKTFCPDKSLVELLLYMKKVANFFQTTVCKTMGFGIMDWKHACDERNAERLADAHNRNKNKNNPPPSFSLPPDVGPEKKCMLKLRSNNTDKTNYEKSCLQKASVKYDPTQDKWTKTPMRDICYQIFFTFDCMQNQTKTVCATDEQKDFDNYRTKSLTVFDQSLCSNFTSASYAESLKLAEKNSSSIKSIGFIVVLLAIFNMFWF